MSDNNHQNGRHDHDPSAARDPAATDTNTDTRLPYEAPRLIKKRSIARATLFTAMGPSMTGLTMQG